MTDLWKRLLAVVAVLAIVSGIYWLNQVPKPGLVGTSGRIFTTATVVEVVEDNRQEDGSRVGNQVVMLSLVDTFGQPRMVEATSSNGLLFGTVTEPGMKVIALLSQTATETVATVYSLDRSLAVYGLLAFFLLSMALVGGKKGCKSALSLVLTVGTVIFIFFPLIMRGVSPIIASLGSVCIAVGVTLYLLNGWGVKTMAASLGTLVGLLVAATSALIFGRVAGLSGYNVSNIEALLFVEQNTQIDVGGLLFAGILIASLGAVLDIAMDISSALYEIKCHTPNVSREQLYDSGINIGQDVMGTMASTLILAFLGSSLGTWVLDYVYNLPYLQLLNSNAVGLELMQGLSGGLGVVYTVPAVTWISSYLLDKMPNKENE